MLRDSLCLLMGNYTFSPQNVSLMIMTSFLCQCISCLKQTTHLIGGGHRDWLWGYSRLNESSFLVLKYSEVGQALFTFFILEGNSMGLCTVKWDIIHISSSLEFCIEYTLQKDKNINMYNNMVLNVSKLKLAGVAASGDLGIRIKSQCFLIDHYGSFSFSFNSLFYNSN